MITLGRKFPSLHLGRVCGTVCAMSRIWLTALWSCMAIVGATLFYWAGQLSTRYHAYSTGFRKEHPNFNPPAPKTRILDKEIMLVGIFRFLGALLVLLSIAWFYSISRFD